MTTNLLARALPTADWAIGACDGSAVIEVRRLCAQAETLGDRFVVVECHNDGSVKRIDSKRGMTFERAKARAIWLAGTY